MTTMQRAQFDRYGPPDVLHVGEVPMPQPGPGEVLVRVHGASVNGGEVVGRAGGLRLLMLGSPFPRGTGIDFAGEIQAVEENADNLVPGDRVWGLVPRHQYTAGRGGSAAEFVSVPLDHLSRSPKNLDLVSAAALPAAGTTAITAVRDVARLREGDRLLVRGASGGVGSVAVQLGKALGARVTGLASGRNLDLVTELGADEAIDYTTVRPADLGVFDVVVDTAGSELAAYGRLVAPRGRMVTITPRHPAPGALGRRDRRVDGLRRPAGADLLRRPAAGVVRRSGRVRGERGRPTGHRHRPPAHRRRCGSPCPRSPRDARQTRDPGAMSALRGASGHLWGRDVCVLARDPSRLPVTVRDGAEVVVGSHGAPWITAAACRSGSNRVHLGAIRPITSLHPACHRSRSTLAACTPSRHAHTDRGVGHISNTGHDLRR